MIADALQDAGCDNDDVLNHCRDRSVTHVRAAGPLIWCWGRSSRRALSTRSDRGLRGRALRRDVCGQDQRRDRDDRGPAHRGARRSRRAGLSRAGGRAGRPQADGCGKARQLHELLEKAQKPAAARTRQRARTIGTRRAVVSVMLSEAARAASGTRCCSGSIPSPGRGPRSDSSRFVHISRRSHHHRVRDTVRRGYRRQAARSRAQELPTQQHRTCERGEWRRFALLRRSQGLHRKLHLISFHAYRSLWDSGGRPTSSRSAKRPY